MTIMHFKNQVAAIKHLHELCLQNMIKENSQYTLANSSEGCQLEKVDTSKIHDRIEFNYNATHQGKVLLFLEMLNPGFEFRFFSLKFNFEYMLERTGKISYQYFDDYSCKEKFPVDHAAVAESVSQIKNYFSKKLK